MPKWICKVTRSNDQLRLTIPKTLAKEAGLYGVRYLVLDHPEGEQIAIRRLEGGETFGGELKKPPTNGNR